MLIYIIKLLLLSRSVNRYQSNSLSIAKLFLLPIFILIESITKKKKKPRLKNNAATTIFTILQPSPPSTATIRVVSPLPTKPQPTSPLTATCNCYKSPELASTPPTCRRETTTLFVDCHLCLAPLKSPKYFSMPLSSINREPLHNNAKIVIHITIDSRQFRSDFTTNQCKSDQSIVIIVLFTIIASRSNHLYSKSRPPGYR